MSSHSPTRLESTVQHRSLLCVLLIQSSWYLVCSPSSRLHRPRFGNARLLRARVLGRRLAFAIPLLLRAPVPLRHHVLFRLDRLVPPLLHLLPSDHPPQALACLDQAVDADGVLRHLVVYVRVHPGRRVALQQVRLVELQQGQRHLEQERAAVVCAQHHVPDAEQRLGAQAVGEHGEEPLEGQRLELDRQRVQVRRQLWKHRGYILPKHLLVGPRRHQQVVIVPLRQDALDDRRQDPERVLGRRHDEQQVRRDEIHPLAIPDLLVAPRVRHQHLAQLLDAGPLPEEDVVRERPVDVHLYLTDHGRVILVAVLGNEVLVVSRIPQPVGAGAFRPNLCPVRHGNAAQDQALEFVPLGAPDLALVAQARDADHLAVRDPRLRQYHGWRLIARLCHGRRRRNGRFTLPPSLGPDLAQEVVPLDRLVPLQRVVHLAELLEKQPHRLRVLLDERPHRRIRVRGLRRLAVNGRRGARQGYEASTRRRDTWRLGWLALAAVTAPLAIRALQHLQCRCAHAWCVTEQLGGECRNLQVVLPPFRLALFRRSLLQAVGAPRPPVARGAPFGTGSLLQQVRRDARPAVHQHLGAAALVHVLRHLCRLALSLLAPLVVDEAEPVRQILAGGVVVVDARERRGLRLGGEDGIHLHGAVALLARRSEARRAASHVPPQLLGLRLGAGRGCLGSRSCSSHRHQRLGTTGNGHGTSRLHRSRARHRAWPRRFRTIRGAHSAAPGLGVTSRTGAAGNEPQRQASQRNRRFVLREIARADAGGAAGAPYRLRTGLWRRAEQVLLERRPAVHARVRPDNRRLADSVAVDAARATRPLCRTASPDVFLPSPHRAPVAGVCVGARRCAGGANRGACPIR
ncbi:hypothetical protein TOPH_00759 [Tolypocladium ophioglossoides CBS 100239]|uniref:Uncharacterized protein n=1 Tax=Tolypocladium ophioglossoides (strain CBS 100239) TaxID=1163406 RepID=A0A0L0NKJ7_TOLOC|nr:hypothetical protein TOPH_00759 [Tolypocladium ophioglossoides CBS 100239]